MKNEYLKLKKRQQTEFNDFPMFFAFSNKQFEEGMKKFGLLVNEIDKIYKTYGGGFYKRTDSKQLKDMTARHNKEQENAIKADTTGENYICEMFQVELDDYEYNYTLDASSTLEALGLTREEVLNNPALLNGFRLAGGTYL